MKDRFWFRGPIARLCACTRGATAVTYIVVVGLVALVGLVAFGQLRKEVESAARAEALLVSTTQGVDSDGPTGSLYAEAAAAGVEQALVAAPWMLAGKGARRASAAGYRKKRGHTESEFSDKKSALDSPSGTRGDPSGTRGDPSGMRGDPSGTRGDPSGTRGDPSGTRGDPSGTRGDPSRDSDGASERDGPACTGPNCSGDGTCFVAGTPVQTSEGPRAIDEVQVGDRVLSSDELSGELSFRRVTNVFERETAALLGLTLADPFGEEETLWVTFGHPFRASAGWVEAGDLHPGDLVLGLSSELQVVARVTLAHSERVYNFEVEETHSYFVGDSSAWVHNMCKRPRDDEPSPEPRKSGRIAEAQQRAAPTLPSDSDYFARTAYFDGSEVAKKHNGYASGARAEIRENLEKQLKGGPRDVPDYAQTAKETAEKAGSNRDYIALTQDAQGRPSFAAGRIVGSQSRGDKPSPPNPLVGDQYRNSGNSQTPAIQKDDRGHLVPEDGVSDGALPKVNSSANIVPENALINQQYKQEFENVAKKYAADHPDQVVFTMHVPHYSGNDKRPDRITHFIVVDGKIRAEVTFANPKPN